jgi:hypothetical protein
VLASSPARISDQISRRTRIPLTQESPSNDHALNLAQWPRSCAFWPFQEVTSDERRQTTRIHWRHARHPHGFRPQALQHQGIDGDQARLQQVQRVHRRLLIVEPVRIRREINAPCQWKVCRSMA